MTRSSDPDPSRWAAEGLEAGYSELAAAIRKACRLHGELTAWRIAEIVDAAYPGRWYASTIRSACGHAETGVERVVGRYGEIRSPHRVRRVCLYRLPSGVENVVQLRSL